MADVASVLNGALPILLLQPSFQARPAFPALLSNVESIAAGRVAVGTVSSIPAVGGGLPDDAGTSSSGVHIADPGLELIPHGRMKPPGDRRRERARYLDARPAKPEEGYARAVMDAQRAAGATVLLSPTGWIESTDAERSMSSTMRWVDAARGTVPSEPMLVSLTLPRTWLADPRQRDVLLEHVLDSDERYWYVRTAVYASDAMFQQPRDESVLDGLAELSQLISSESKTLILANSGMLGWLGQAFGASGLSTGTGGSERSYSDPEQGGGGRGGGVERKRYFEPALLHFMELPARNRVIASDPTYARCPCPYCDQLSFDDVATFDKSAALRHYVMNLTTELAAIDRTDPRASVRSRVEAARQFYTRLPTKPTGDDRPRHLEAWGQALS